MSADTPTAGTQARRCGNCDAHVSRRFIRVMGVDGEVDGCPNCRSSAQLLRGAAIPGREPDYQPRGIER